MTAIPRIRTTAWLAEYFSKSPKTMREWIRIGRLRARKIGRDWYVKDADLARVIE